jgi:hypothetical protein
MIDRLEQQFLTNALTISARIEPLHYAARRMEVPP